MKLLNADCKNIINDIVKAGNKYCIVTDPPFNIGYHYNTYNDRKDEREYFTELGGGT